jgi:hypothetical protein
MFYFLEFTILEKLEQLQQRKALLKSIESLKRLLIQEIQ